LTPLAALCSHSEHTVGSRGDLGRKSLLLVSANWTATALGFLCSVLIARRLGPEAVGALGYGFGLIGVAGAALLPGFAQAHTKRVAEGRDLGRCVATMGAIQLALQISMVAIVLGASWWWPGLIPPGIPAAVVFFLLASQVSSNLAVAFSGALIGRRWAVSYGAFLLGGRGLRFVATVAVLVWAPDVRWIAGTYALEGVVELVLGFYIVCVSRGARLRRPDRETLTAYWDYSRPLLITSPIGLLQDSLDRVLVARWAGLSAAGFYQIARGLWEVLGTLNAYPFQLLFARLSELFARRSPGQDQEARRLFASAVDKLLFLVVPAAFALWALREPIIVLLYGRSFLPAEWPLMVFVLAALAQAAINPYHFIVYALEAHRRFIPVVLLRLAIYLVAMTLAVQLWGGTGAAGVRLLLVLFPAWVYFRWTRQLAGIGFERRTWIYVAGFGLLSGVNEAARAGLAGLGLWPPAALGAAFLLALGGYAAWLRVSHSAAGDNLRYARDLMRPSRLAGLWRSESA
jgi:O-antigen/teichoic acid export membrane protein